MKIEVLENYVNKIDDGVLEILDNGLLTGSLAYGVTAYDDLIPTPNIRYKSKPRPSDIDIALLSDQYDDIILSFKMSGVKVKQSNYKVGIYLEVNNQPPLNIFCLSYCLSTPNLKKVLSIRKVKSTIAKVMKAYRLENIP